MQSIVIYGLCLCGVLWYYLRMPAGDKYRVAAEMLLLHLIMFGMPLLILAARGKIGSASYLALMVIMAFYLYHGIHSILRTSDSKN